MKSVAEKTERMLEHLEAVNEILKRNQFSESRLIPILQQVQEEYRYLPKDVMAYIASSIGIPPAKIYGVATFYSHFALEPKGKYVFKLCDGTACHVKGSMGILDALRKKLGLKDGESTTADMLFTVETVSCLGACGLAPVLVMNDEVHGQLKPSDVDAIVEAVRAREAAAEPESKAA